MSSDSRCSPHPLVTFDTSITGIRYDGVLIPLDPLQVRLLVKFLKHGSLRVEQISQRFETATVYISNLRETLRDTGFPFEIETVWGEKRYRLVPIDPKLGVRGPNKQVKRGIKV